MSREVLLLFADTHAGSDTGLCCPETKLYDTGSWRSWTYPKMTKTQLLLWDKFSCHTQEAKQFAGKDPVYVGFLGDASHGSVFHSDAAEPRFLGQYQIAWYNACHILDVFGDQLQKMMMVSGTNVHTWDSSLEYRLAHDLRHKYERDIWCYPHILFRAGETTHDLAHHGPSPGKRVWTKANAAQNWLKNMMIRDIMGRKTPQTVTYRAHFHEWVPAITHREASIRETGIVQYESHFLFVPGYSGLSDHARKATKSEDIVFWGMVAVEIIDGRTVNFYPMVYPHDTRIREEVDYGPQHESGDARDARGTQGVGR